MKPFLTYICLLLFLPTLAQEYNYVHYDTRDGLAGSTVYRICEDKKGYIWFATDNGVSMFDGKRFKNFTTEDGLTDNEVVAIGSDSRGRVWMMPFNKSVCYYYEGTIYNAQNDSALKNAHFTSRVIMGGENKKGDVYLTTTEEMYVYTNSGQLKLIADFKKMARQFSVEASDFVPSNQQNQYPFSMILFNKQSVFIETDEGFVYLKELTKFPAPPIKGNKFRLNDSLQSFAPKQPIPFDNTSVTEIGKSKWMYNTLTGSWLLDEQGNHELKPFLPGKKVSSALLDSEGNIWFATIGEGVYRLTSLSMKTFSDNHEAFCLEKANNKIYAGSASGSLRTFSNLSLEKEQFFAVVQQRASRRLYTLKSDPAGNIYLGFDLHLARVSKDRVLFSTKINPVKSIDIIDSKSIVVATNSFTMRLRSDNLQVIDTIFHERATKVIYEKGLYYIGTLNGLVIVDSLKNVTRVGQNDPLLNKRIVDMCKMPDGGIWMATNDNGVLLYSNNKVNTVINMDKGLSSNICKSIFLKDRYLWVGTNKGLNKIDIIDKKVLVNYSISDGLASDNINAIYAEDSLIWICSPAGVTYFREKDISDSSICILDMVAVHATGDTVSPGKSLQLSYENNHISFDYTAISFKSAGEILYKYKLKGLDDDWKETRLTTLSYPSLPPGSYEFELYAVNKFGKSSKHIKVLFSIASPFWKTLWFWVLLVLLAVGSMWYLLNRRYKRLQTRMREKNELIQRMMELEQASLRAQMNPHFIFNCLSSIQHFMLKGDVKQTNEYISQFGTLIRQTMDNSATTNISIADEINYLTSYLELEQMRFPASFHYEIFVDKHIEPDYTLIPSMLLQPFVENAIRHGLRNKLNGTGLVRIGIRQDEENLIVTIEDNGVGWEAAARYKSEQHIEYQSKGITLTQKRIDILNAANKDKIIRTITDLKDENNRPTGTKILLSFPLSVVEKLN